LESLFNDCFTERWNTQLIGGAQEPLYQPAAIAGQLHSLFYREDFFASALHEVAHWCIAGEARRQQLDFGYWYAPEGRSPEQQKAFETAEIKPQALEWYFSTACGYRFQISVDNFDLSAAAQAQADDFKHALLQQALH
jgi:elongation factor P hydroxylase